MKAVLKLFLIKVLLFLLFIISVAVYPDTNRNFPEEYTANNQLGFVKHLISGEEFYRAFVELKRLDSYYPGYVKKENIFTTELYLLFQGHRYSEIPARRIDLPDYNIKSIHTVFSADAFVEKSEFIKANDLLKPALYSKSGLYKDIDFYLCKRSILTFLLLNKIDEARNLINNNTSVNSGIDIVAFSELTYYTENYFESFKKPYNAMLFGIIPGMGYVYAGKEATGIIAFILISVLSTLTYYSFKTDNKPVGIFIGAATSFFYGGSIIGGYLSAKDYNKSATSDLKKSLSLKMQIAEDRERIYNDYGIGRAGSK